MRIQTLDARNLTKRYGNKVAVENISISLRNDEIVGLLGPNGAGKSTCFYMLAGLIKPDAGSISLNDQDITNQAMHKRANYGLTYLPQESSVFRTLTAEDNLKAIIEQRKELNSNEQSALLNRLVEEFGLAQVVKVKGQNLSGGERRRLEIARSIANDPCFILLDEPFAGIDPISLKDIKLQIRKLKKKGIGILITDHNVREILDICDRAYIVNAGSVIANGNSKEILKNEKVKEVYLGKDFST